MATARTPRLLGRRSECEALDRLVATVRAGESAVLVIRGGAGVGKSALLAYLVERASGCRIARAVGVESEMELPFAGLHQLCAPMLDGLDGLPGPQRDALRVAFGLQGGATPERFAMVFAVREPHRPDELAGLPELVVEGIADSDARALLASAMPGVLDER